MAEQYARRVVYVIGLVYISKSKKKQVVVIDSASRFMKWCIFRNWRLLVVLNLDFDGQPLWVEKMGKVLCIASTMVRWRWISSIDGSRWMIHSACIGTGALMPLVTKRIHEWSVLIWKILPSVRCTIPNSPESRKVKSLTKGRTLQQQQTILEARSSEPWNDETTSETRILDENYVRKNRRSDTSNNGYRNPAKEKLQKPSNHEFLFLVTFPLLENDPSEFLIILWSPFFT